MGDIRPTAGLAGRRRGAGTVLRESRGRGGGGGFFFKCNAGSADDAWLPCAPYQALSMGSG